MVTDILDKIIALADAEDWSIDYIALSINFMKRLVEEVAPNIGEFEIEVLVSYKDTPLKVKSIHGFQTSYQATL